MTPDLLLWWLFGSLAAFRIATAITKESGPRWIFCKLRKLPPQKSSAREGLACPFCVSVYSSAAVCGLFAWSGLRLSIPLWIVLWLSVSAGAVALNQMFVKDL